MRRRSSGAAALLALGALATIGCGGSSTPGADGMGKTKPEVRALHLKDAEVSPGVIAGDPIEVLVRGDLPNPGYKFLRWDIHADEDAVTPTWSVTPLVVYTLGPGDNVIQIVVPFEGTATFDAPGTPGDLVVEVHGFTPEETIRRHVTVFAPGSFLELKTSGGIAGISDRILLTEAGEMSATRSLDGASAQGRLSSDEMAAIRAACDSAHIADLGPRHITENAADLFLYELTDLSWSPPLRIVTDDMAMPQSLRLLIGLLQRKANALLESR